MLFYLWVDSIEKIGLCIVEKKKGIFPRSNRLTYIDYENKQVILKFSKCSFKINLIFNTKYKNKK